MTKPLVFISYRSKTAKKLKPIIEAVLAKGYRLFIDFPENFDYDASTATVLGIKRIGRQSWRVPLRDGLDKCDAVLLCLSKGFDERERVVWREEFVAAHLANKLVACSIDGTMPGDLGKGEDSAGIDGLAQIDDVPARHVFHADGTLDERKFSYVLADLAELIGPEQPQAPEVSAPVNVSPSSTEVIARLPLSVDVDAQTNFTEVFDIAARGGTLCPLIVMAPETEQVEGFIDAHLEYHVPRSGIDPRRLGNGAGGPINLYANEVSDPDDPQFARTMTEHLRTMIHGELPEPERNITWKPDDPDDRLSALAAGLEKIASPGVPLVCVSAPFRVGRMRPEHRATVDAWLRLWHGIGERMSGVGLVPILPVMMTGHPAGWQKSWRRTARCYPRRLFSPFSCRNGVFHAHVTAMTTQNAVRTVGVLPPVEEDRARNWAKALHESVMPQVEAAFGPGRARRHGLTMTDFRNSIIGGSPRTE